MLVLGIETSCDETSVAVVRNREVLSNVVSSSLRYHQPYGGVIPEIASRQHLSALDICLSCALKEAKVPLSSIQLIAVTQGPGLIGSLLVGSNFAKALSYARGIPLIAVHHLHAHIFAAFLNKKKIVFPFLGLVVSGGHTELYHVADFDHIQLLGKTRDDACGETLDKVGRFYGLGYPAGPLIDKLFSRHVVDEKLFRVKGLQDNLDFSFSGIKTKAICTGMALGKSRLVSKKRQRILSSFEYAAVSHILDRISSAYQVRSFKALVCGGGVVANSFLRQQLEFFSRQQKTPLYLSEKCYCSDSAAPIAGLGFYLYNKNHKSHSLDVEVFSS